MIQTDWTTTYWRRVILDLGGKGIATGTGRHHTQDRVRGGTSGRVLAEDEPTTGFLEDTDLGLGSATVLSHYSPMKRLRMLACAWATSGSLYPDDTVAPLGATMDQVRRWVVSQSTVITWYLVLLVFCLVSIRDIIQVLEGLASVIVRPDPRECNRGT